MDREIPEQHARLLRNMVGAGEFDALPSPVEAAYWEFKRVGDRVSTGPTIGDLIGLCVRLGYGKEKLPQDDARPTLQQLWKKRKIKAYTPVIVQWRDGEVEAKLIRVSVNGSVVVDFDGTERSLPADKVRLAELVEA